MRLTGKDDVDIALDSRGQPKVDSEGGCLLVSGDGCWMQDVWLEAQVQEGELAHEDEEGRMAYGFGLADFYAGDAEEVEDEVYARVREKLSKREYIDANSVQTALTRAQDGMGYDLHIGFKEANTDSEEYMDIHMSGLEVSEEE